MSSQIMHNHLGPSAYVTRNDYWKEYLSIDAQRSHPIKSRTQRRMARPNIPPIAVSSGRQSMNTSLYGSLKLKTLPTSPRAPPPGCTASHLESATADNDSQSKLVFKEHYLRQKLNGSN